MKVSNKIIRMSIFALVLILSLLPVFGLDKSTRMIGADLGTVEMVTDKLCTIDYNTERIKCEACFNMTIEGKEGTYCVSLMPDASDKEDNEMITAKAREVLNWEHPLEDIAYTEKQISGNTIRVKE